MSQFRARQVAAVLGATLFFFGGPSSAGQETRLAPIVVSGPTVVAFFMAGRSRELSLVARADFERYAGRAAPALKEAGIDFHEIYPKRSIKIQTQGHTRVLKPPFGAGYYFLTADGVSKIEYGIKTDLELLQHARQYLPRVPARPVDEPNHNRDIPQRPVAASRPLGCPPFDKPLVGSGQARGAPTLQIRGAFGTRRDPC